MAKDLKAFILDEDGAVTADWVVLTAAVMLLGVATVASVQQYATNIGPAIAAEIDKALP